MNIEAGTEEIFELLIGTSKEFSRMDLAVKGRFLRTIEIMLTAKDVKAFGIIPGYDLKFFNGKYQIRVTQEKRMRFTVLEDTILIEFFGSTTHRGEAK